MRIFQYKAVGDDGTLITGEMEAVDERAVIRHLRSAGQLPISAEPKLGRPDVPSLVRRLRRGRALPRPADVTALTRELATLLTAGIPVDSAMRLLLRHSEGGRMHSILNAVQQDVQSGKPMSAALACHPEAFDALYVSLIRAGEASGALESVLEGLATHREKAQAFRASIVSALAYPIILLVVAILSLFVLMSFVVPRFIPLFSDVGQSLPLLTQVVFSVSELFAASWWVVVAGAIIAKLGIDRWLAVPANRKQASAQLLKAPIVGRYIQFTDTIRLCRTLATVLRNGLPLLSSLKLSKDVVRNAAIADMTARCMEAVQSGSRLSYALRREGVLPALALELIMIGEESGQLEAMLEKAADTFEARVEQQLKRLLTVLEPVLILGLGGVIGIVIVAILMAMLGLNELII